MDSLDVTKTQYKVSDFVSWQRSGSLVLSPSFQRRPVWRHGAKSFLIDTMVRGLPIPIIFLRDQRSDLHTFEPKREVVDGQQRIRTVLTFIDPSLLEDYIESRDAFYVRATHNKDISGKAFNELPVNYQQRILDYEFSVHVLSSGVDDREVLGIFARMNSTGVKLNPQELRNAEYFGEFKTSMFRIAAANLPRWRAWDVATEDEIARMQEVELTSELAMVILSGIGGKTKPRIDNLYKRFDKVFPTKNEVERRFYTIMDTIEDRIGAKTVAALFNGKTLVYGLFSAVYDAQFGLGSELHAVKPRPISVACTNAIIQAAERIHAGTAPVKVQEAVTRRTTNVMERSIVYAYLRSANSDA